MAFRGAGKSDKKSDAQKVYTLQVVLAGRRPRSCVIEIAGSHTLEQLHQAIHGAFDRRGSQPWEFQTGGKGLHDSMNRRYGPAGLDDGQVDDAGETTIEDLRLREGKSFGYIFNLGTPQTPGNLGTPQTPGNLGTPQTPGNLGTPHTPGNLADPSEHTVEVVSIQKAGRGLADPRVVGNVDQDEPRAPLAVVREPARSSAPAPSSTPARDAQAAACSYILVALLQRLETLQPGLTSDLLAGIEADRAAVSETVPDRELIERIFDEALKTVRQAAAGTPQGT